MKTKLLKLFLSSITSVLFFSANAQIDTNKVTELAFRSKCYNSGDNTSITTCKTLNELPHAIFKGLHGQISGLLNDSVVSIETSYICLVYRNESAEKKNSFPNIYYQLAISYYLSNGLRLGISNLKLDSSGIIQNPNVIPNLSLSTYDLYESIALIKNEIPLSDIQELSSYHTNRSTAVVWEFISIPDENWKKYKRGKYCYQKICKVNSGTGKVTIQKRKYTRVKPKYLNVNF